MDSSTLMKFDPVIRVADYAAESLETINRMKQALSMLWILISKCLI